MTAKTIFVAGLTHSGSTILDFLLGAQSTLIGLGEVIPLLDPRTRKLEDHDRLCSCGRPVLSCVYWGEVHKQLSYLKSGDVRHRYSLALRVFNDVFGPTAVAVDSSKSLSALRIAAAAHPDGLRVIHIVRDVRSWTVSRVDVDVRLGRYALRDLYARHGIAAWKPFLARNPYARFLVWYLGNRRLERFLSQSGVPALQVSYEDMCFREQSFATELCSFVGLRKQDANPDLATSRSHIALGNRVRLQRASRGSIRYDTRWFHRTDWHGPSLLFPHVMRYNRTTVYKQSSEHVDRPMIDSGGATSG